MLGDFSALALNLDADSHGSQLEMNILNERLSKIQIDRRGKGSESIQVDLQYIAARVQSAEPEVAIGIALGRKPCGFVRFYPQGDEYPGECRRVALHVNTPDSPTYIAR
jgi:hypothetical protein